MNTRRVKLNKNLGSFQGSISRSDLQQFPYPSDEATDTFQYTTPRPLNDVTMPKTNQKVTRATVTNKMVSSVHTLESKIRKNRYAIIAFIVKSLIAVGSIGYALFQAISLIISFSQRPVEISLSIVNPTTARIPAVSVCFEYKLDLNRLDDTIETRKKVTASKSTDPTVEIIINTTPGVDDLVESCLILNHLNQQVPCSDMSTVRQSITRKLKCFSWFTHGSWKSPENETQIEYSIRSIRNQEWVAIKLKNLKMISGDTIGIGIHQNHVPVEPDLANPEFTEVRRTWYPDALLSKVTITWELSTMTRLPKPYGKGCIDYKKSQETVEQILLKSNNYDVSVLNSFDRSAPAISTWLTTVYASQRELIDSCIGYSYATRYNDHWPSMLLAHETKQKNFFLDYRSPANATNRRLQGASVQQSNDRKLCNKLFSYQECIEASHSINIRTSHYDNSPDDMKIVLYVPTDTQTHMVQVPKYESREIIAIISGIFSFWIGISVIEVVLPIIPFFCGLCAKLTTRSNPNNPEIIGRPNGSYFQKRQIDWAHSSYNSPHGQDSHYSLGLNKKRVSTTNKIIPPSNKVYNVYW